MIIGCLIAKCCAIYQCRFGCILLLDLDYQVDRQLTDKENSLLKTVAIWLRGEMVLHLTDVSPSAELLYDLAQSNYEISCSALARIGMFVSEGGYWRVQEVRSDGFVFAEPHTRTDLDHLLDGLACHSHNSRDLFQRHQAVSPTKPALQDVCRDMVECGYMKVTSANSFIWNDDFGPWLVRHNVWNLDDFETAPQETVDLVLATIPGNARERLSGFPCRNKPDFVRCFFAQWINGKWEEGAWRYAPSDGWDLCLAAGIYEALHGK